MGFDVVELGDVCDFLDHKRRPVKESERHIGPYPYYGANGQQGWINEFIFNEPLVLLAEDGGYFGSTTRPIAYKIVGKSWVNNHAHVLRPKANYDVDFLHQVLSYYDVSQFITGTTRAKLTKGMAEVIPVPLPPLPEQRRIAAILARADRLRRLRRTALQLSESYLQSVFVQMFGDPVTNPMGWNKKIYGELVSFISGHGFKLAEYATDGIRLLQIANVGFQEVLWDTLAYLPENYVKQFPKLVLQPGDLLMALNRPILGRQIKFAVLTDLDAPAILYQRVGKITVEDGDVNQTYLYGFMLTDYFYAGLKNRLAGSDQPYINPPDLGDLQVPIPPLPLQQRFAAVAARYERLRGQQREALRQAEHLFQTLLHRAFRGELGQGDV